MEMDRAQILLSPTIRQSHYDAFIQDAYKATPKLTINFGVRYDFYEAPKVRYAGGASNYEPSTNSLLIAGYGNISLSDGVDSKPGYIDRCLGLAYSLGRKTAVRAGYGISYWEQRFGWTGGSLNNQYPVIYNVQVGTTSSYVPAGPFSSITPVTYVAVPSNGILNPAPNQTFYYMPSHFNLPAVYNWNLTLQHQITPTLVIDAGWVANQGRNLPYSYNMNQGLPGAGPNCGNREPGVWPHGIYHYSRLWREQQLQFASGQLQKAMEQGLPRDVGIYLQQVTRRNSRGRRVRESL